HFFSVPPAPSSVPERGLGYATELFHFKVPHKEMTIIGIGSFALVSGNDVAARLRPRYNHRIIRSPEKRAVAQVVDNHVYILFDWAHRPWEGAIPVLWEIFELATPFLIGGEQDDSEKLRSLIAAHRKLRLKNLKIKKALLDQFGAASRFLLEQEHRNALTESRERQQRLLGLEKEIMEAATEIEMLKEILANPEKDEELSVERLREEFELIHRYKGLSGVKIIGDELQIFTEPIEHIRQSEGRPRLLSQYKIVVNLYSPPPNDGTLFPGIRMAEWGWLGPFQHPEYSIQNTYGSAPKSPCFGNTYNSSIRKALYDQDYKVLIALLLHYLDSDDRPPQLREERTRDSEPYKPKPFYASDEIRNQTREDYINFVKKFRGTFRRQSLEERMSRLEGEEKQKIEDWSKERKLWLMLDAKAGFIRFYIGKLPAAEELDKILNLPAFMNMKVGSDFIWCVFGPGKGLANFKDVWFSGAARILVKMSGGETHIWHGPSSGAGVLEDRFGYDRKLKYASSLLRSYCVRGLLGKMLVSIHNIIRGEIPEEGLTVEDISVEQIAEYIRQNPPFGQKTP
ncbi:MAG: hypothetical protein Q8L57_01920, partial [bacterium]|nr:hypothetical protein [bacterium]